MARDNKGFQCHIHTNMVSYEIHHIWPTGYHGPDTPDNRVKICPNAHSDIHYLLERMLKGKPNDLRQYGDNVVKYARLGYERVNEYAETLSNSIYSYTEGTTITGE